MGHDPNLFSLIPVLDLLNGHVVRAVGGLRDSYAPIQRPPLDAEDPDGVLKFLLDQAGSRIAYLADLNAIQGGAIQDALIERCLQSVESLWLDAGFRGVEEGMAWAERYPKILPVLGTETLSEWRSLKGWPVVLSLDTGPEGRRGDPRWWTVSDAWPERVMVMNLHHVGRQGGPDFEGLLHVRHSGFEGEVYAAGGVRDKADLDQLKALGVNGALVASMLYAGTPFKP